MHAADGEVVWSQCRRFEVPAELAASPQQELQIESGTGDHRFASALCFPKFAKEGAATVYELRKAGTRRPDAGVKFRGVIHEATVTKEPGSPERPRRKPL